jgi:hypothetical protein
VQDGVHTPSGPGQPLPSGAYGREVFGVLGLDDHAKALEVLGRGELEVEANTAGADREDQQWPRPGASQLQEPILDRMLYPRVQFRVGSKEAPRDT